MSIDGLGLRLQTGCGRSFREGECRRPPEPAVRPLPRRLTAVVGKLPHAWLTMPADAMLTLVAFALAKAMNSATVVAGTEGWTSITIGML